MVLHSFILVSCPLYLSCHSCLCDILILTCSMFRCQLIDVEFVKRMCVCMYVCVNLLS